MSERIIFHIDVNSAFVSWSSVKLLLSGCKIDYRTVPSIAAKNMSKRGSIVAAKSIPAKSFGIVTGEPTSFAVRKCPGLVVLPLDFEWYRKCSADMMNICYKYSNVIQQFSIDECFIDMSNFNYQGRNKIEVAYQLKNEIKSELGFTVNVGIGSNKLLAKMASDMEKPDKVHYLHEGNFKQFLWHLDVQELFFCGPKSSEKLRACGIYTIGDLANSSMEDVQRIIGQKFGTVLWLYANGIDDSPVVTEVRKRKSISHAHTLEYDVNCLDNLLMALREVSDEVVRRLILENERAKLVFVNLRKSNFETLSKQHKEDVWINTEDALFESAVRLVKQIYQDGVEIRQVGVGVSCFEGFENETNENAE